MSYLEILCLHLSRRGALCIIVMIFAASMPLAKSYAARPVSISDIIGVKKLGQIAVSTDGASVAYLVIQAAIAKDAYSISLVVTSSHTPDRHELVAHIQVPARREQATEIWEDVGSNLTGGIAFTWSLDNQSLIYMLPGPNNTSLIKRYLGHGTSTTIGRFHGEVVKTVELADRKIGYCVRHVNSHVQQAAGLTDPAYRYDGSTFHAWDKYPWQDGRGFKAGQRPAFEQLDAEIDCFELDPATMRSSSVTNNMVQVYDPFSQKYSTEAGYIGRASLASRKYEGGDVIAGRLSPDGKHILFTADVPQPETAAMGRRVVFFVEDVGPNPEQKRLFELKGTQEGAIRWFFWAPDSRALICFRTSLQKTIVSRFDTTSLKETPLLETDWGIGRPTMSLDGRHLYVGRQKPNMPQQLCRIDLVTGEMLLIDDINVQFKDIQEPPFRAIRQFNSYGDELTGYLFYPPGFHGETRLPFIAIRGQHWNEFCDGGTGVEFPGTVMAMKGYVVLFFEAGTKHFGDSQDGNAEYSLLRFKSPLESLGLLITDLTKQGWIDPTKSGLAGLSYGADLVDYAAGFSKLFTVGEATTGDGYAPENYILEGNNVDNIYTKRFGLPFPDANGLPAWKKVSAALNASHSNVPLLFQPGDAEAWVSIAHHVAWEHAGLPVETYVYPDEGHIKIHPRNRYFVMTRNLQWFDFWLSNIADNNPEYIDQFRGWEKMRHAWEADKRVSLPVSSANTAGR
jgi:dipeptidyl aminopeptidase/acylaminoacyl peptidase